jgi:hypothetical protein
MNTRSRLLAAMLALRAWSALGWSLAALITAWGGAAVWQYGWRDLYADQWRLYEKFIQLPFPQSVLFLENGHRPVVPNLLRVAELQYAGGSQEWQLAVGLALSLLAVVGIAWICAREREVPPGHRAFGAALGALGVFWLGNARMLMHPNESVHTYLIVASLVAAALAIGRQLRRADGRPDPSAILGIGMLGLLATFSFGPGIALLPAATIVLAAARARPLVAAMPLLLVLPILAIYFSLPGGEGVRNVLTVRPLDNVSVALRWLGAPALHLLQPLLDPNASHWFAGKIADPVAGAIARHAGPVHGPIYLARWPMLVGAAGAAYVGWRSLRTWRQARAATRLELLGMLFAWFGLGAAAIVSLTRLGYFDGRPEQLYAGRYLPWSCLFWAGVALLRAGNPAPIGVPFRLAALVVLVLALALNPLHTRWSRNVQQGAHALNVALAAGIFPREQSLGETVEAEVMAALPAVRAAGVGVHGDAASRLLGTQPSRAGSLIPSVDVQWRPLSDRRGGEGHEVRFVVPDAARQPRERLWLLIDDTGHVVGLAHPEPRRSRVRMRGYLAGPVTGSLYARVPDADPAIDVALGAPAYQDGSMAIPADFVRSSTSR